MENKEIKNENNKGTGAFPQRKYIKQLNIKKLDKVLNRKNSRLKKYLPFIIFIIFLALIFGITYFIDYQIKNAKPGDLLFSIKSLNEESNEPEDLNEKVSYKTGILKDRINILKNLSQTNNCVQLILTEDNLILNLKELVEILKNSNLNNLYSDIYTELAEVENIQGGSCSLRKEVQSLPTFFRYLTAEYDPDKIDFNNLMSDSVFRSSRIISKLKETAFNDQETLNNINNAMLEAEQNGLAFSNLYTEKKFADLNKLLMENFFIYNQVGVLIGEEQKNISQENIVRSICLIQKNNSSCSEEKIQSDWNSVYSRSSITDQVNIGQVLIDDYINKF